MLTPETLPELQRALAAANIDGWLLFDFQGVNPIATGALALEGFVTRRVFAWIPREGVPVAVTHDIEQGPWHRWPKHWKRERYNSWKVLERTLASIVKGKRVAMEYSPGDAVPYLDRVPGGVLEMVRAAGAEIVSSGTLVSRFYAMWTDVQLASHKRVARVVAATARAAFEEAGKRSRANDPITEYELQQWIVKRFGDAGLEFEHDPIVAVNEHAANPHYEPSKDDPRPIRRGDLLLIDLWAREPEGIYADQTWMGSIGEPTPRMVEVWTAVRDARDAAIALLREKIPTGATLRGAEVDDAARNVLTARGFGEQFVHRTGHSIDSRQLHGSGPHIDNFESREVRELIPGLGFSIEPGAYLSGELGVRAEVNAFIAPGEVIITPEDYQHDLIVV
ncbi:MAG TPA: Xaa-Pro peptidase family protein [Gemmatimonadaceae bacterium]|nr:Xaa-Pro peptidase family protein [Gemmatimonadaceae bacterium]